MSNIIIMAGEVTGSEIKTNRDGKIAKRMLQVRISDVDDIQTVQFMSFTGDDTNPPIGSTVLIVSIGEAWKIAVASDDSVVPSMAVGEKKIYSLSGGTIQAYINLLADGTIELNGNIGNAVKFAELKAGFDEFINDFNTFITAYNSHVHGGVTSGASSTFITTPGSSSSASIDTSEVPEVKLP